MNKDCELSLLCLQVIPSVDPVWSPWPNAPGLSNINVGAKIWLFLKLLMHQYAKLTIVPFWLNVVRLSLCLPALRFPGLGPAGPAARQHFRCFAGPCPTLTCRVKWTRIFLEENQSSIVAGGKTLALLTSPSLNASDFPENNCQTQI